MARAVLRCVDMSMMLAPLARLAAFVAALAATAAGCTPLTPRTTLPPAPPPRATRPAQRDAARDAIAALRAGRFARAAELGRAALARDSKNPQAHVVVAITRYERAMREPTATLRRSLRFGRRVSLHLRQLVDALRVAERELVAVDKHLAAAQPYRDFSLSLCLACIPLDWNRDGRIDRRDRRLFAIERGADGRRLARDDPARRPTFRFDVGDIAWARAYVAFQRALFDVVLAYDFSPLTRMRYVLRSGVLRLRLLDAGRVHAARARIREGLAHSDVARRAYLAETDDRAEWVPNPRQKNHPMPLPVDARLYQTWRGALGDLRLLVDGKTGLSLAELAQLLLGPRRAPRPPLHGYLDVGSMLARPRDIVVDLFRTRFAPRTRQPQRLVEALLGAAYRPSMPRSKLVGRLLRVRRDLSRGSSTFGRKLRYLLWIN